MTWITRRRGPASGRPASVAGGVAVSAGAAAMALGVACGPDLSPPAFPDAAATPGLEEKLERQWLHFDHARGVLAARGLTSRPVPLRRLSRARWERLLAPAPAYRATAADLEELRSAHQRRIERSRDLACDGSALDLDAIRGSDRVAAFARQLPKGGMLHVHPNGTLAPGTVARMLDAADPRITVREWRETLSQNDARFYPHELAFLDAYGDTVRYSAMEPDDRRRLAGLFHLPPGRHGFERFAVVFRLISLVQADGEAAASDLIYEDLFRRAREHGVIYMELTTGFRPEPESMARWDRLAGMAEHRFGLVVRVNLAFDRTRPPSRNLRRFRQLLEADASSIAGIDLVGREDGYPALERAGAVYGAWLAARNRDETELRATIHAAGLGDIRNVRDAVIFGVDRVGHGAGLVADPVLLEYGARRALPVEANLTSNVRLRYVRSYEDHPFLDLLRLGYRVSLSTDDEGILDTDISREFARAIAHSDICYDELRRMSFNSIDTAFVGPELRLALRARLEAAFQAFEAEWSPVAGNRETS